MTKRISIVLVDDNVVAREAIATLIRQQPGFDAVVASANAPDAVNKVRQANARAVLVDARLHNHHTIRLTRVLSEKQPHARIIVTGVRPHQHDITAFVKAGASGFVMRDASLDECLESIRVVTDGGHALPRRLVGSLFEEISEQSGIEAKLNSIGPATLTNRERQVLGLIGDGLGNKEIAATLHIAGHTVRSHVASLFKKLGVRTRLQVAVLSRTGGERPTQAARSNKS